MHYDLGTLLLCQFCFLSFMVAKTASEVQTKGWDEVTETMFFWDVKYLIPFTQGQVLASVCLLIFSCLLFLNKLCLPWNMLKNYKFLFITSACSLLVLRAKKARTCLTPLSCVCRADIIGSVFSAAWKHKARETDVKFSLLRGKKWRPGQKHWALKSSAEAKFPLAFCSYP